MHLVGAWLAGGLLGVAVLHGAELRSEQPDLAALLARVADSVSSYYARAQSIMCLETVRLQSLGHDLLGDSTPARRLDYELRVAWNPAESGGKPEASVVRDIVRVNGRAPRPKDEPGCMDPKSISPEPLAMFLAEAQKELIFTFAGRGRVNGREAMMIDYRSRQTGEVTATWNKDCFTIELPGRTRGRVWIDPETAEVLRLDERLTGMLDYTLPREHRKPGGPISVTVERLDSSIVYRPVVFTEPDERLMLPASITTVTVVRNSGSPRMRTTQAFSNYQRFITGGRIVQ